MSPRVSWVLLTGTVLAVCCGICGRSSLDAQAAGPVRDGPAPKGPRAEGDEPKPKPAKCPVPKPETVPEAIQKVFSADKTVTLEDRKKEIQALLKLERDDAFVDALRWLAHQNDQPEEVRHEALLVLGNWHVLAVPGDLAGMMTDPLQQPAWRAKALEHLGFHYNAYMDKDSLQHVEAAMASEDLAVRDMAVLVSARLAQAYSWDHANPERHKKVVALVDQALGVPRKAARLNAIQAVGMLGLKGHVARMEALAADHKADVEVRLAALKALAPIAQTTSLGAVEACAKSGNAELAGAAEEVRPFVLAAQLMGQDAALKESAFKALHEMGMKSQAALAQHVMSMDVTEAHELSRTILGDALLKGQALEPVDRKDFKVYEDHGKPRPVWLNVEKRMIIFEGEIAQERAALEYAVVCKGENAKLHECVLALDCSALDVIYSLLACEYTYVGELKEDAKIKLPPKAGVMMSVEFERETRTLKGREKKIVRVPLELLVWNTETQRPMRRVPWAFTGSKYQKMPDGKMVLMAQIEKGVVSIMYDPHAILNTILDAATAANVNPEQGAFYTASPILVPKKGSKISLVFEPWGGAELKPEDLIDRDKNKEAHAPVAPKEATP